MSSPCCSVRLWSLRNGCRHRRRKRRPAVRAPAAVPADAGCCLRPAGGRRTGKTVLAGERCRRPLSARRRELLRVSARRWHAYIVKHIIHDWEDEDSTRILQVVRRAIPDDGAVLLIEADLGPPNEAPASNFGNLNMLVLPGGRERTLDEYALFESTGFRLRGASPTMRPCVDAKLIALRVENDVPYRSTTLTRPFRARSGAQSAPPRAPDVRICAAARSPSYSVHRPDGTRRPTLARIGSIILAEQAMRNAARAARRGRRPEGRAPQPRRV
jgi:O-methyltransferase domain